MVIQEADRTALSGRMSRRLRARPTAVERRMSYLRLMDVQKTYGGAAIGVRAVSLDIAAGEFVSFLGPSGSGKTTTLSMVAGFVTPSAGRIEVDGRDITHVAPEK